MTVSRRKFLKTSAVTAAATMASGSMAKSFAGTKAVELKVGPGNKWPGRVVINFNKAAVGLNVSGNPEVATTIVKKMVDDSVLFLTEKTDIGEAWKSIFPATLSATSTIAIKVPLGCATQRMSPHFSSVKAIIDGLTSMDFGGTKFPAANITIYEMRCSDNFSKYGYTSANLPGVKIIRDSNTQGATDGAKNQQYAKSLQSTFLINVFRPGGHSAYVEGWTLGFKNHYGSYDVDHNASSAPGHLRDINCTGVVFNKNVLSVCVGLFGAQEASGAPGSSEIDYSKYSKTIDASVTGSLIHPTTIIMSTDPITAEMQTIKMMRINNGKMYSVADLPKYLKASGGVDGALSDKVYNIGIIDEAGMDIRKIINGEKVTTGSLGNRDVIGNRAQVNVKTLLQHNSTFIEFTVPHIYVGTEAQIEIVDLKGMRVYAFRQPVNGVLNNHSWNHRNFAGGIVRQGSYIVAICVGTIKLTQKITVVK